MKKRVRQILRFSRLLLPYGDKLIILYLCTGFSLVFGLLQPYLSRVIIDFALIGRDLQLFNLLVIAGAVIYLFSVPIDLIQKNLGFYVRTKVSFALRSRFYRRLQLLSLRFAQSRTPGEHQYRLGPDLESVVSLVVDTVPAAVVFPVRLLLLLGVCLWLNWRMTAIVLALGPLIFLHAHLFNRRQYRLGKEIVQESQGVSSRLQEALALMKWTKVFGKERAEAKRYLGDVVGLVRLNVRSLRLTLLQSESSRFLNALIVGGITYALGFQVVSGALTVGLMTALTVYLFQLLSSLKAIGVLYGDFVQKFIAVDRVEQTLDADVEVRERPGASILGRPRGEIAFEDITFGYAPGAPVLDRVSLEARAGTTIALIGPSGAGKTTLSHLLIRLYDPWSGRVLIDGRDIRDVTLHSLRQSVGFASHEPFLVTGSIFDNIRFSAPGATDETVFAAACLAEADGFIRALPRGYETPVGQGGHLLSQGQRQRIALARAVVMNPRILVLDEALSALEADCEQRILDNLRSPGRNWTVILMSHRLAAVSRAETIHVLNRGLVEERGTHEELMRYGHLYRHLYRSGLNRSADTDSTLEPALALK